jgi:hypothetical protein
MLFKKRRLKYMQNKFIGNRIKWNECIERKEYRKLDRRMRDERKT